jgi:hypothetical protein
VSSHRERFEDLPDPVFFGLLEGMCFFCLFISPLFPLTDPSKLWLAVAILRVVVLGVVLLPSRGTGGGPERGESVRKSSHFLAQGVLYQIPFWASALLFPLQSGQAELALGALLVQCAMLGVLAPLARWGGALGAETVVYLLTMGWVLGWRQPGPWLALAVVGFFLTCRGPWSQKSWGWHLTPWQGLAVGLTWLVAFALPPLSVSPASHVGPLILFWVLLIYLGTVMATLQRESAVNIEVECSLPNLGGAQVWLLGRRSVVTALGWFALVGLVVQRPQEALACLVLLTAWWRALELSARGWFTSDRVVWWAALEITVIWVALRTSLEGGGVILVFLLVLSAWVHGRRRPLCVLATAVVPAHLAALERNLASLHQAAPKSFAARVMREAGSIELDKDLAASAPAGFRERLLERLRQANGDE